MATTAAFIPAQPIRVPDWLPGWRGMTGERLRRKYGDTCIFRITVTRAELR